MTDFTKIEKKAPGLVDLAKTAAHSLHTQGLDGLRAAVYLVLDRSMSMAKYYRDGSVQHLADQALGLSVNVDDDGVVPLVFFDSRSYPVVDIRLSSYTGVVAAQHRLHGGELTMGGTRYGGPMRLVTEHYLNSGTTDPALVIFQTDGQPQDQAAARAELISASQLPIFWSFIGYGNAPVPFLEQLDDLPGRDVDNASYLHVGPHPQALPARDLYDGITAQFAPWLTAARAAGITT
ncbi:VWA domain-containing protein [Streptomyces aureocirculatus]|uniref:VWA domain-containing protein n=1 Tax=Streptomyces aureocirculatus TaxID=67275 RepID=UPI0004C5FD6E|nr:VWA domain-containing protein [Streptomyces aureocirculatus]